MEAGEKKDALTETLARYEKALLDDDGAVDEIEDELLALMEDETLEEE
jgi:hypothetical protein